MKINEILESLFPDGHSVENRAGILTGRGILPNGTSLAVIGIDGSMPIGVDEAVLLSSYVLRAVRARSDRALLVLIDSGSQRMSKREELLGLSEYFSHLASSLLHADINGLPTIGLLYGHTAAGAFIASALATRVLIALPGASPAVMDLPSMARVTKLPIEVLQEKAKSTPVFAPGLQNLSRMGAVALVLTPTQPLAGQVQRILNRFNESDWSADGRDLVGKVEGGRPLAADVAERVRRLAHDHAE